MKKEVLTELVTKVKGETKYALQTLWDNINKGQQKQIIKIPEVKVLLDRYGVEYGEN